MSSFTTSKALYFFILTCFCCPRVISIKTPNIIIVVFIGTVRSKVSFLITYETYKLFLLVILIITVLVLVLVVLSPRKLWTLSSYMTWLFTVIANNHVCCFRYHIRLIICVQILFLLILA